MYIKEMFDHLVYYFAIFVPVCEACDTDEFTCQNSLCVDLVKVNNSVNDCGDNSDEGQLLNSIQYSIHSWSYMRPVLHWSDVCEGSLKKHREVVHQDWWSFDRGGIYIGSTDHV